MKHCYWLLAICSLLPSLSSAQKTPTPLTQKGYVTHITSNALDVDGSHVLLSPSTRYFIQQAEVITSLPDPPQLWLGEFVEIKGGLDRRIKTITAEKITLLASHPAPISGTAIIDLVPTQSPQSTDRLIRADGYLLLLPTSLHLTFHEPLTSISELRANIWITYHGTQRSDGIVVLDRADLTDNVVNKSETNLRNRSEYNPADVAPGTKQSATSRFFHGLDPKMIPAWLDPVMQARVEHIGISLIPAYQRTLSESDPTRINFRFQVVDRSKLKDSLSLESGVILVPYQVVQRLQKDSQLAAVLADSIAENLEKQTLRQIPAKHKMTAAEIAGGVAGIVIPGAEIATSVVNYKIGKVIFTHALQQSSRVSLCILHDAGYDLEEAPIAWWLLGTKPGKDLATVDLPSHAAMVYGYLGDQWRPNQALRTLPTQQTLRSSAMPPSQSATPAQ